MAEERRWRDLQWSQTLETMAEERRWRDLPRSLSPRVLTFGGSCEWIRQFRGSTPSYEFSRIRVKFSSPFLKRDEGLSSSDLLLRSRYSSRRFRQICRCSSPRRGWELHRRNCVRASIPSQNRVRDLRLSPFVSRSGHRERNSLNRLSVFSSRFAVGDPHVFALNRLVSSLALNCLIALRAQSLCFLK